MQQTETNLSSTIWDDFLSKHGKSRDDYRHFHISITDDTIYLNTIFKRRKVSHAGDPNLYHAIENTAQQAIQEEKAYTQLFEWLKTEEVAALLLGVL